MASVNPLGCRVTYAYNAASEQVSVMDGNGHIVTTLRDISGRVVGQQNALGYITTNILDANGQMIALQNARGCLNSLTLDASAIPAVRCKLIMLSVA